MLFSVVIPSYNRAKVVKRAIDSVLSQTFQDFEVLIVDDGSVDDTKEVVSSIPDKRIRYIYQNNQGATVARNTGVLNAQGEYVSFLDSDDIWYPQMLEKQLEVYNSDSEIGWVYANLQGINAITGEREPFGIPLGICGNVYAEALKQGYVAPTTVVSAKRDALMKVGLFDVDLPASQDDDICFKLAKAYKVGYISEYMAGMITDPSNRISDNKNKVALGWWMLWNKYEKDVLEFCGKEVMERHYFECARRFALIKNIELFKKTLEKVSSFDGSLTIIQKLFLRLSLYSNGFCKRYIDKMLNKL